ncbi:ATPase family associated with various cellular activities (AAA) [Lachnospiraceae bacterium KH1T2]|nr:ATPase family associated with various cellular activities (AAA) [Lachnospiraceae bacterium KH1T2]
MLFEEMGNSAEYLDHCLEYALICLKGDVAERIAAEVEFREYVEMTEMNGELPQAEKCLRNLGADYFVRAALSVIYAEKELKEKTSILSLVKELLLFENSSSAEMFVTARLYEDRFKILFPEISFSSNPIKEELIMDEELKDILSGIENERGRFELYEPEEGFELKKYLEKSYIRTVNIEKNRSGIPFIYGEEGVGKRDILKAAAVKNGRATLAAAIKDKKDLTADEIIRQLLYAYRICILFDYSLAVTGFDRLESNNVTLVSNWLKYEASERIEHIYILSDSDTGLKNIEGLISVEIRTPDSKTREEEWKRLLKDEKIDEAISINNLAETFILTPGKIQNALEEAKRNTEEGEVISKSGLYEACYSQISGNLSEHASRIDVTFGWDDLILKDKQKEVIADICSAVRYKGKVMNDWNFKKVLPYGAGISCLFAGPPGTGKTMSAQVIAKELSMELYRVDMSKVMDKYVGETEKNIKAIFDEASKMSCILFFDEADAIFNKRLEASGANERFANIESSLLLQCIEDFRGIAILATNNQGSIDNAFLRRFKFYLKFTEPDEDERLRIWEKVFPQESPLSDEIDFREFAHVFEFTGAFIKNVALQSAFMAAAESSEIDGKTIVKAAKREMEKTGRMFNWSNLGSLERFVR